ncbi:protein regulator of cytokinesis 1 [Eurytemora carolleeae]|uniref:protein regulator of cytokinesis 1 n=1 Tax=Eurytemora carolleeae TaxID=1294199 RepID=UPI000C75D02F|nr:protein regulator of cytokinesis 1 [Eurytemora carolleeae]|eukprot:XP_023336270.1 protein regulator of cytokinesis 1-like [Eurytemora affinis]
MEGEFSRRIKDVVDDRVSRLEGLWEELGIDEAGREDRSSTVLKHITELLDKMVNEDKKAKKRILDSLEYYSKQATKLSQELGISFEFPDSSLVLVQYERAVRHEAKNLEDIKNTRLEEVKELRFVDEELCSRLGMDPFYISTTTVPNTEKLDELKEHIKQLEKQLALRIEQVTTQREEITRLYQELDMEPSTEMERELVCESLDRFVLSAKNIEDVGRIQSMLEDEVKKNQKEVCECIEKIDALYARLQLDDNKKFHFLSNNRGHSVTVIASLKAEIVRLEEIKRANIEKFIINIRDELNVLWDDCFYSEEQRNEFLPLHSTDFSEALLEAHETEVARLKTYYEDHKELFLKVSKRQEVWNKFMELERRAKDPSRLMNARGNSLLLEEKERNKVNKNLPRVEQELHQLIKEWENETGRTFLVHGVDFQAFIEKQKEEHLEQLEAEKVAREQAKKRTILQETRFGAKPATPAKLKQSTSGNKTNSIKKTPGSSRILSRINTGLAMIRSPRTRMSETPTSKNNASLRQKRRDSYGIKRGDKKDAKTAVQNKNKLARGVLSELDNSIVSGPGAPHNFTLRSVDYAKFNKGNFLNSTKAENKW